MSIQENIVIRRIPTGIRDRAIFELLGKRNQGVAFWLKAPIFRTSADDAEYMFFPTPRFCQTEFIGFQKVKMVKSIGFQKVN